MFSRVEICSRCRCALRKRVVCFNLCTVVVSKCTQTGYISFIPFQLLHESWSVVLLRTVVPHRPYPHHQHSGLHHGHLQLDLRKENGVDERTKRCNTASRVTSPPSECYSYRHITRAKLGIRIHGDRQRAILLQRRFRDLHLPAGGLHFPSLLRSPA